MTGWEDARRWFRIFDPQDMSERQGLPIVGVVTDVDAFALIGNAGAATTTIDVLVYVDLAENGGWVNVHARDVILDVQTALAYAVTRIANQRGILTLTCSQTMVSLSTTPVLPPT